MLRRTLRRRVPTALATALVAVPCAAPGNAAALTDTIPAPTLDQRAAQRPAADLRRDIVAAARERIGAGYAMGARGPDAYDCSGLTAAAFAEAGIALPRTSFAQYGVGEPVARDAVRRGDLVFFSTAGAGASHVGVATGERTVVSATSSGGVMEHASDDAYWGSAYVGARRISEP